MAHSATAQTTRTREHNGRHRRVVLRVAGAMHDHARSSNGKHLRRAGKRKKPAVRGRTNGEAELRPIGGMGRGRRRKRIKITLQNNQQRESSASDKHQRSP